MVLLFLRWVLAFRAAAGPLGTRPGLLDYGESTYRETVHITAEPCIYFDVHTACTRVFPEFAFLIGDATGKLLVGAGAAIVMTAIALAECQTLN